jgi:hypothetical protein
MLCFGVSRDKISVNSLLKSQPLRGMLSALLMAMKNSRLARKGSTHQWTKGVFARE